jgi:uncharacterized damage-inducible protein DinB
MSSRELNELLLGTGSHASPIACVEDLSTEQAARQVSGFPHSIGQLVFHMNYWMEYELRRIRGTCPAYPKHASESWPDSAAPSDAEEWDRLRKNFAGLLAELAALTQSSPTELARPVEATHEGHAKIAGSLEAVLWQTVAHNSYHVGQIVLLRRALGAWPPRAGGDTW